MEGNPIKKILKYVIWFYIIPSLIWEFFVYLNDGVDPSEAGSNIENSRMIQDAMKNSGLRDEDMGSFSGGSLLDTGDKRDRDQLNAEFKMMGMDARIGEPTPKKRRPATNSKTREYIDENGFKVIEAIE